MALQVWLPLNKDFKNNGLTNVKPQIIGNPSFNDDGICGKSILLLKDNEIDTSYGTGKPSGSLTICVWVKPFDNMTTKQVISTTSYANKTRLYLGGKNGTWNLGWGSSVWGQTTDASIDVDEWQHLTIVCNDKTATLYKNGQITNCIKKNGSSFNLSGNIKLGNGEYSQNFIATDLRIYDHCITEDDVKRIYNCKMMDIMSTNYNNGFFYDNSGILINNLVSTAVTYSGGSMYFNGLSTTSGSQIRPKDGTSGLNISGGTLSVWFTPLSKPKKNILIYTDEKSHMSIGFVSTGNSLIVRCGKSNGNTTAYATTGITWGSLNNIIVTYENTMPQSCFINGASGVRYTSTTGFTETAGKGLTIGGRQYNATSRFNGYISKVTVFRNQLTEDEAKKLYSIEEKFINEHLEYTKPYLTFTALEPNSTVQLNRIGTATTLSNAVLQYSVDGGKTWNDYTFTAQGTNGYSGITITLSNVFDSVKFKGINSKLGVSETDYHNFKMNGKISAKGDVTSLLNAEGGDVNMTTYCCINLFINCTSLTTAPELPATDLAVSCYAYMFYGCSSLTTAPELPATTLKTNCYYCMFDECTSLTTAPELPATTLQNYCYAYMFKGCTSLTTAPELPATTLQNNCYYRMFQGCTSLTTAPELPATDLALSCYSYMFYGCTNLNYIKALFKTRPSETYTNNWVYGVSPTGTFIKNSDSTWLFYNSYGIPNTWNIYDETGQQIFIEEINYDDSLNIYHIVVDDFRNEDGDGEDITTEEYLNDIYFNDDYYGNEYYCIGTFLYEGNTYYIWENNETTDFGYLLTTDYEFSYEDTIRYNHNNRNCVVWGYLDTDLNGVYTGDDLNEYSFLLFDYWVDE